MASYTIPLVTQNKWIPKWNLDPPNTVQLDRDTIGGALQNNKTVMVGEETPARTQSCSGSRAEDDLHANTFEAEDDGISEIPKEEAGLDKEMEDDELGIVDPRCISQSTARLLDKAKKN
ncbi:hypothetical protein SUGI_0331220 [Cryptomeria japonica]|nr:hypothetical protein SUGI_0331220 [Cryptomeria japonica]